MTDTAPIQGNGLGTLADPGALIVRINPQIPAFRPFMGCQVRTLKSPWFAGMLEQLERFWPTTENRGVPGSGPVAFRPLRSRGCAHRARPSRLTTVEAGSGVRQAPVTSARCTPCGHRSTRRACTWTGAVYVRRVPRERARGADPQAPAARHLRAAARVRTGSAGPRATRTTAPRVGAQTFRPRSRPNARMHASVIPRPQPWRCPSGVGAD